MNHVVQMLETAGAMFEKAMDAFIARDVELARQVCGMDDQVDAMFSKIVLEVCGTITENPQSVMKEVDLMFITKYIERMGTTPPISRNGWFIWKPAFIRI